MRKTLQRAGFSTFLATLLLATQARGDATSDALTELGKKLEEVSKKIGMIENTMLSQPIELKKMRDEIAELKKQINAGPVSTRSNFDDGFKNNPPVVKESDPATDTAIKNLAAQMKEISKRLDRIDDAIKVPTAQMTVLMELQREILELKSQMGRSQSSFRVPSMSETIPPQRIEARKPNTGTVRISNRWNREVSIVLNDGAISSRILPGEEVTLNVPAGWFTYEFLDFPNTPRRRYVGAGAEFPVEVNFPR